MLLLLAALPLRAYAAVGSALCETHHGDVPAAHHNVQDHGAGYDRGSPDAGGKNLAPAASICSLCAGSCVGATLTAD